MLVGHQGDAKIYMQLRLKLSVECKYGGALHRKHVAVNVAGVLFCANIALFITFVAAWILASDFHHTSGNRYDVLQQLRL